MGSLFTGPSTPNLPKPPEPGPIPVVGKEPAEEEARKVRKRRGFKKTLITGALTPETGKKSVLG